MNQINIDKNILLVEVPEQSTDHFIHHDILYWDAEKNTYDFARLPEGSWQFIGTTDEVSEEMAAKIVAERDWLGGFGWMYKNYMDDVVKVHERKGPFKSVLLSFASLLRKHNIPSDKRFAILKLNP